MQLMLGQGSDPSWIRLEEVESFELRRDCGLRLVCVARMYYPLPLVSGEFTVSHAVVEMMPAIIESEQGPLVAFQVRVAEFDVKYLPAFIDDSIAKRINESLQARVTTIAWNFSKTLTRDVILPKRLELVRQIQLGPPGGVVEVTENAMALRISLPINFGHEPAAVA